MRSLLMPISDLWSCSREPLSVVRLLSSAVLLALPALALAQGSLTPPGAPAPTMKTLTQIEPRTPLQAGAPGVGQNANGGFTIAASGSYYLTANLTVATGSAIVINAGGVSLDLNGFTLTSTAATPSGAGISLANTIAVVTVRNGHIQSGTTYNGTAFSNGPGFLRGFSGSASSVTVEDVTVTGVSGDGIYLYANSIIRRCRATVCADRGLNAAMVSDSMAETCRGVALGAAVGTNCNGFSTQSIGVHTGSANNCTGFSPTSTGLYATTATNCHGSSNSGIGLEATSSATGCTGKTETGPYGLKVGSADLTPIGGLAEHCRGEITGAATVSSKGLFARTATNCIGTNIEGAGLHATDTAVGCTGVSTSHVGLFAIAATNCMGTSTSGTGLYAEKTATGCTGKTAMGTYGLIVGGWIRLRGVAVGCFGEITDPANTNPLAAAIWAGMANDCVGIGTSVTGLAALTATNCTGTSTSATGLVAGTATNCYGSSETGTAIQAEIAVSCRCNIGATIVATQKFLGTP